MELKILKSYSESTLAGFLQTPSGVFYVDQQNNIKLRIDDVSSLRDLYTKAINNEIGSATDKRYLKRELAYQGEKATENVDYVDHLVLQDIPTDEANQIEAVAKDLFENFKYFYVDNSGKNGPSPQLIAGKREVSVRLETNQNGNTHLHLLIPRRGLATIEDLEFIKENSDNPDEIAAINKALSFSKDNKNVLTQSFKPTNHYVKQEIEKQLNAALAQKNLTTINGFTNWAASETSNQKQSGETKSIVNEIVDSKFDEEVIQKVLEKNNSESSYDSIAIDKLISANTKELAELQEQIFRKSAEQRKLQEAKQSIADIHQLKQDNATLANILKETQDKLESHILSREVAEELHKEEIEEIKSLVKNKDIELEAINEKLKGLTDDYEQVSSEIIEYKNDLSKQLEINNKLEEEKNILETSIKNIDEELKKINEENERIREQLKAAKISKELDEAIINELKEGNKSLREDNNSLREDNNNIRNDIKNIKEEKQGLFDKVETLQELVKKADEDKIEFKKLEKDIELLRISNNDLNTSLDRVRQYTSTVLNQYVAFMSDIKTKIKNSATVKKSIQPVINKSAQALDEVTKKVAESDSISKLQSFFSNTGNSKVDEVRNKIQSVIDKTDEKIEEDKSSKSGKPRI